MIGVCVGVSVVGLAVEMYVGVRKWMGERKVRKMSLNTTNANTKTEESELEIDQNGV